MPRDGSNIYHQPFPDVITDTEIESAVYNGFTNDVAADLNAPRPISAGGTGASDAATAMANLNGEVAKQGPVTNYDSFPFVAGSFYSAAGATGAATANAFSGIVYVTDSANMVVEARDASDGKLYIRRKITNVWNAWALDTATVDALLDGKVDVAGDTMTGDLTIAKASPVLVLAKTDAAQETQIIGRNGANKRWMLDLGDSAPEGGSDAGSDFSLNRYNDGGAFTGTPLSFNRATGLGFVSGDPTTGFGIATKQYSDKIYSSSMGLTTPQLIQARQNIYAAPFDAMMYNGIQVNGACEVDQETLGGFVVGPGSYGLDNWFMGGTRSGAVFNGGKNVSGLPAGFVNSVYLQVASGAFSSFAAGEVTFVQNYIEGVRCRRLNWGTANAVPITVSFWTFSTVAGTATFSVRNAANNRTYLKDFTITAANTWQYVSLQIPGDTSGTWDTAGGRGLLLNWCFGTGSSFQGTDNAWNNGALHGTATTSTNFFSTNSNACHVIGLVVLPGTEAPSAAQSPFIQRHFDQELILCQRLFQLNTTMFGQFNAPTTALFMSQPFVLMRATPVFAVKNSVSVVNEINVAGHDISAVANAGSSYNGIYVQATTTTAGTAGNRATIAANTFTVSARF